MKFHDLMLCLSLLAVAGAAAAAEIPVSGVTAGQSEFDSSAAIAAACGHVTRVEVAGTRFPAATHSEVHLRCDGLTLASGQAGGDAIFTFADDRLVLFEARGASTNLRPAGDPAASMAGFEVFLPQQLVIDATQDRAIVFSAFPLAPLALHWKNPAWLSDQVTAPTSDFFLPPEATFGASQEAMTSTLEKVCAATRGRPTDKVWLATKPAEQFQIDCYGYQMAGYPRKLEFVFGDGLLQQMWLLFDDADIPRLRTFLTRTFGTPVKVDANYEVFDHWRIALRKDVPEIRMVSEAIAGLLSQAHDGELPVE